MKKTKKKPIEQSGVTVRKGMISHELLTALQQSCALNEDDTITCDVGNPLPSRHEASFAIRLDTDKLESTTEQLEIVLIVNT